MKLPALSLFIIAPIASAQLLPIHIVHHFDRNARSVAPLTLGADGNLYGTTQGGGSAGWGTVFRLTPGGTFTTLVNFTGPNTPNGSTPYSVGLVADGAGNLYGTTEYSHDGGNGTVFKMTLAGNLTTLVSFHGTNGANPRGLTVAPDGTLYGTTVTGTNYYGTVFKITADGGFTTLANFPADYGSFPANITLGPDGHLYGRTYRGGTAQGAIFRVTTNGALTTLGPLFGQIDSYSTALTLGNDGNFYGTTYSGGSGGRGTAFRLTPQGAVTTLVNFHLTNGAFPAGPLTLGADGNFYGTTLQGNAGGGTVFRMTPAGELTTLAKFTSPATGDAPHGGVTFGTDGSLYGTTAYGGTTDGGLIFRVDLPPTIGSHPGSRTNAVGTSATFSVTAAGTLPLRYQWLKNGIALVDGGNVSGTSTSTLTLASVQQGDAGEFAVVVTNNFGSVTSFVALLTVSVDMDGDGVMDDADECPNTAPGAVVDEHGCSIQQRVPCAGPRVGATWKNHGQYVSALVNILSEWLERGVISEAQAEEILQEGARSNCGKR